MFSSILVSFVLSQFFGLYLLVFAFLLYSRVSYFRQLIQKTEAYSGVIILSALIGLFIGMFLVGIHNVWDKMPAVFITLFCWFILVASLLWLLMPERMLIWTQKTVEGTRYYVMIGIMAFTGSLFIAKSIYSYVTQT